MGYDDKNEGEISINNDLSNSIEKLWLHSHIGPIYEKPGYLFDVVLHYIHTGPLRRENCVYLTDVMSGGLICRNYFLKILY